MYFSSLLFLFTFFFFLSMLLNDCFICCKYHVFLVFIVFHENTSPAEKFFSNEFLSYVNFTFFSCGVEWTRKIITQTNDTRFFRFVLSWCWNSKYSFSPSYDQFKVLSLNSFSFHLPSFRNFLLTTFRTKENAPQKCEVKERYNCPKENFSTATGFSILRKKKHKLLVPMIQEFLWINSSSVRSFDFFFHQNFYNWKNFPEE